MLGCWDFHKSQNHGIPDWAEKDLEAHLIPLLAWGQVSSAEGSQGMLQPPTLVSPGRGWQGCGDHPSCIHQPITSSLQGGIVSAGIGVDSNRHYSHQEAHEQSWWQITACNSWLFTPELLEGGGASCGAAGMATLTPCSKGTPGMGTGSGDSLCQVWAQLLCAPAPARSLHPQSWI